MARNFYGIRVGRDGPNICEYFDDCQDQVRGFPRCEYKGFDTREDAHYYVYGTYDSDDYDEDDSEEESEEEEDLRHCNNLNWYTFDEDVFMDGFDGERVFTDGCSLGNGQYGARSGYGVYWGPNDERNASLPVRNGEQTNNHAELLALYYVFRQISEFDYLNGSAFEVYSDSQYACNCITSYSRKWARNGWVTNANNPVKHQNIIKGINTLINRILNEGAQLDIMYIPAHKGWHGNEQADALAKEGANKH